MKLALVMVALVTAVCAAACQSQPPLEVFGRTPEFTLTDHTGTTLTSESLAGRVVLMDFIYTHCADVCPLLSSTFAETQRKLADDKALSARLVLVSVSVDPTHDSPAVLAEYARRFKADAGTWKFATGDWDEVYNVLTGLKLATRAPRPPADAPPPGGTELSHTSRVVLLDPQGQVRAYLEGQEASADELLAAARRVM